MDYAIAIIDSEKKTIMLTSIAAIPYIYQSFTHINSTFTKLPVNLKINSQQFYMARHGESLNMSNKNKKEGEGNFNNRSQTMRENSKKKGGY